MINVSIVWDFDGPIGNINATFPYNFSIGRILSEFDRVNTVLEIGARYDFKFVFAVTGFTAEEGYYPYNNPDIIRTIFKCGHEVASHSWKHEWFPALTREQIVRSLKRSKLALEKCIDCVDAVKGFVLPHSRPMTWKRKLAFSLSDRGCLFSPGSDIQTLLPLMQEAGYRWTRLQYKTLWERLSKTDPFRTTFRSSGMLCVPQHCLGFAPQTEAFVERAIDQSLDVVIIAHPAALDLPHAENIGHFVNLIEFLERKSREGVLKVDTISNRYL